MSKVLAILALVALAGCPPQSPRTGSTGGPPPGKPPPDPCAVMRCAAGTQCVADGGRAQCVAVPSRDPCKSFSCAAGTHCISPDDRPRCVADASGPDAPLACKTDADCPRLACGPCNAGETVLHRHVEIACLRNPCPAAAATCKAGACVVR